MNLNLPIITNINNRLNDSDICKNYFEENNLCNEEWKSICEYCASLLHCDRHRILALQYRDHPFRCKDTDKRVPAR